MHASLKSVARVALHRMGGLATLRRLHRREFGVLMFHSFSEKTAPNVEALCLHITRHFRPLSLSTIVDSMAAGKELPDNSLAVTVDDGYRNFLLYGHPVFRRHNIPVTLYVVVGFADGRLWLWPDQIEFGLLHTSQNSIRADVNGLLIVLPLNTPIERAASIDRLQQALMDAPDEQRLRFLAGFAALCDVEILRDPPASRAAMNWEELRAVASQGVEIGCHTDTHPILSRLSGTLELRREIQGAKTQLQDRLGIPVRHFCYPNGRPADIGPAAIQSVREAGYASAVTCTWGLNTVAVERLEIRRLPFDSTTTPHYGAELLAGLHL